ncbi:nitroreductase family deazaflavin-dependent oxidoreductase [Pseudonocardiaceae bacterium YIM PH 21723]|nr:nitroreductase family deazaflavin-dependent oxidoreductase [Pseudonocardiaceae bacterium YIM PH 21723]
MSDNLELHTVDAQTGVERVTPLSCVRDGDDLVIEVAEAAWFHDIEANPDEVTAHLGDEWFVAEVLTEGAVLRLRRQTDFARYNARVIDRYRANRGVLGGKYEKVDLLLLHTTGAKSGARRINPLAYAKDGDDFLVAAISGRVAVRTNWLVNLAAHPDQVELELGDRSVPAAGRVVTGGAEWDRLFEVLVRRYPHLARSRDRGFPIVGFAPQLWLTSTTEAGERRRTRLGFTRDGDALVIDADRDADWFQDFRAHPDQLTVEVDDAFFGVDVQERDGTLVLRQRTDFRQVNARVIADFRANRGVVGGHFTGRELVLLHTVGARSGEPRTHPLLYLWHDGAVLIAASGGGTPHHPAWFHNLRSRPDQVEVELPDRRFAAIPEIVSDGPERDRLWELFLGAELSSRGHTTGMSRVIPMVLLRERSG